jgi:chemotaxis protein methyltransferase CheR
MDSPVEFREEDVKAFLEALKTNSSYDFSEYSEKSFRRRIEKLVNDHHCTLPDLTKKVKANPSFLEKTVIDITVNTTEIFRDPKVWHEMRDEVIPHIAKNDAINIWHAGCSSGQELYSMAILLHQMGHFDKTNLYGTDLNTDMLIEAKKGIYKYRFVSEYLPNFDLVLNADTTKPKIPYSNYMEIDEIRDILRMKPFLTQKPVFQKHDLVHDKNTFGVEFDLIVCRNVLIYFNNNLQNRVFDMFWKCLKPNGFLVIGLHESIMGPSAPRFLKKGQHYRKILNE